MNTAVIISFSFAGLYLLVTIVDLLKSVEKYFKSKTKIQTPLEVRMENTVNIMLIINKIIELNLIDRRSIQITLKAPFNALQMDKDIKELATYTHNALINDIFASSDQLIVTPDYIEKYIVSQATSALIQCYQETNQHIAQMMSGWSGGE